MKVERKSPWVLAFRGDEAIRHRVFCFPYAGGGASVYRSWAADGIDGIELCAIQLPGRGDRFGEPAFAQLPGLVAALRTELFPHLSQPFSFFGHSMGALIAYELTRALRASGDPMPRHLFVSGRRAPHLPERRRPLHALPEREFREELGRLQGTPKSVLDDPELMDLLTPILRSDFSISETYTHAPGDPLDVPLTVFGGADDAETTREELDGWRAHSRAFSRLQVFPGHHFFLHDQARAVTRAILDELGGL